jgi:hypothetical protein
MTTVGKILVFLNLVFSLIVGGLVMVVYLTRTNWEKNYVKLEANYKAVEADRDQTVAEMDADRLDHNARLKTVTDERDDARKERDVAKRAQARAEQENAALKADERGKSAEATTVVESLEARRKQVLKLEEEKEQLRKDKIAVIEEKNKERAARIQADVDSRYYKARALELESQVKEAHRELIKMQGGITGTVTTRKKGEENPPRENVEGRITRVDPEDNLVQLSIGSDSGLEPGHTLKVFRLHPIPEQSRYLGVIEVLTVRPHEAVGRPLKPMAVPMRPNDRVAARLSLGG